MALSLDNLVKKRADKPPRMVIYGVPGVGKTTLAAEFPSPIFLQTEEGAGALELTTFQAEPFRSFAEVEEAIVLLFEGEHAFRTVVIDSLDWLEPLVWAEACRRNGWASIEEPGYGKGYIETDAVWRHLLKGLDALRQHRGMNVVMLAHEQIKTFADPERESYDTYQLRLHRRAADILTEFADVIGFMNFSISIEKEKAGFKATAKAKGSGQRMLHLSQRPSFVAKNRYGMPDSIMINPGAGYAALAPHLPGQPTVAKAA